MSSRTFRTPMILATAVAAPLILSACESSDVAVINAANPGAVKTVRITEVSVVSETPRPNPALQAALKAEIEKAMPQCAKGTADHRMEVTIVDFDKQNTAQTILVGDSIELSGRVRIVDPHTEIAAGEYFVDVGFFWGGLLGAAMMSNPENRLSKDFAQEVCKEVFGVDLKPAKQ